jgi:hypothetical protein
MKFMKNMKKKNFMGFTRFMVKPENRSPNPRNPKEARNPKSEPPSAGVRKRATPRRRESALSVFGLRISFGFRTSDFGFRV